jgi:hypothetical protein
MLKTQLCALITRAPLNRAQRGLYAGKQRLTGNTISFSHRKYVIWCYSVAIIIAIYSEIEF